MRAMRISLFGLAAGLMLGQSAALALDAAGEGRRVFLRENCYGCHGGRTGGGMGPDLRDEIAYAASVVGEFVLNGSSDAGMPSYRGKVTNQDIKNLSAYILTLRTPEEPTFTHWWEKVPTR
jgi:cytochrome c551